MSNVQASYTERRITTEWALQSTVFAHLLKEHPDWKVYVEPGIDYYGKGSARYKPDLIICDTRYVLAIIEIKFVPQHYPHYQGDIDKLYKISTSVACKELNLEIDINTGHWTENKHIISSQTNFIFMVVGRADSEACYVESITKCFSAKVVTHPFWLFYGRVNPEDKQNKFIFDIDCVKL